MVNMTKFDDIRLFVLASDTLRVSVMELGATVTEVAYRGRPVALAYGHAADYLQHGAYLGAIVGRFANRIGGGRFPLGGKTVELQKNENGNTLHGGADSWDRRIWTGRIESESVVFTLVSPAGDNGFPGCVTARVRYTVTGSELRIDFEGETDADTLFAPTSHLYFNLRGAGSILDTVMRIPARGVLEVDGALIPTGRVLPAAGDFDFSAPRPVARSYDHAFVLEGQRACEAAAGGVRLTLDTDFPALQFYTGDFLGEPFGACGGFAVEPEFYPDAPNHPDFPSALLRPGETFRRFASYRFSDEV
ncbi:MAG: galactose mutarotase [Oscillospiraceae bacterium]|nr:galactose mutarotase [Oscillospiraceae bacterium]